MFDAAAERGTPDAFRDAATNAPRPNVAPDFTPFIALQITPEMLAPISQQLKALYGRGREAALMPLSYYPQAIIPAGAEDVRVISAVNDYKGLQVILMEVDGKREGPDGRPYYAHWSSNAMPYDDEPVIDDRSTWPVTEATHVSLDRSSNLYRFETAVRQTPYTRVISGLDQRAEELARHALAINPNQSWMLMPGVIECLPINIPLVYPRTRISPQAVMVHGHHIAPYHMEYH